MKNYNIAIATVLMSVLLTACDTRPTNKTNTVESPASIQPDNSAVINIVVEDYAARGFLDHARQQDKRLLNAMSQMSSFEEETILTTPSNEDIYYVLKTDAPIREFYLKQLVGIISKPSDKAPRKFIDSFRKVIISRSNSFQASERFFRSLVAYREAFFQPLSKGHLAEQRLANMTAMLKALNETRDAERTAMTSFNAARDEALIHHPDWANEAALELKKRIAAHDQATEAKKIITPTSPPQQTKRIVRQQVVRPASRPQSVDWSLNQQAISQAQTQPYVRQFDPGAARQARIDAAVANARMLNEERQAQEAAAVGAGAARGMDRATDSFTPSQSRVRRY